MNKAFVGTVLCLLLMMTGCCALARDAWPSPMAPASIGTDIHFYAQPGASQAALDHELDLIAQSGVKVVRMDIPWFRIEPEKGRYDFSGYDPIINGLARRGIRSLCPVFFGNKLYGQPVAITTPEGLTGFTAYAAALATHYRGKHIIYEIWNEPNLQAFWPKPATPADYMRLVNSVVPAIRQADPEALILAPALANTLTPGLVRLMQAGLLDNIDGLSVHPYQGHNPPEHVDGDLRRLKQYLAKFGKPDMPVVFTEWGYSASPIDALDDATQGQYLAREALLGMMYGVPINILYEWKNKWDPCPPKTGHCFGIMTANLAKRPAYDAIQKLTHALSGYRFVKRLPSDPHDYVLLFAKGDEAKIAAWTIAAPHDSAPLPDASPISLSGDPVYTQGRATARRDLSRRR